MTQVTLPELGEGVSEATISYWHVEEGDQVQAGDDLVELATDKATFSLPSPCDGVVVDVFFEEGEEVRVGDVIVVIEPSA